MTQARTGFGVTAMPFAVSTLRSKPFAFDVGLPDSGSHERQGREGDCQCPPRRRRSVDDRRVYSSVKLCSRTPGAVAFALGTRSPRARAELSGRERGIWVAAVLIVPPADRTARMRPYSPAAARERALRSLRCHAAAATCSSASGAPLPRLLALVQPPLYSLLLSTQVCDWFWHVRQVPRLPLAAARRTPP